MNVLQFTRYVLIEIAYFLHILFSYINIYSTYTIYKKHSRLKVDYISITPYNFLIQH